MRAAAIRSFLKKFLSAYWPYLIVIAAIVLPWFFGSGYIFLTDNVWGPNIVLDWTRSAFLLELMIKGLSFILPIPFLEKLYIAAVLSLILLGGRRLVKTVLEYDSNSAGTPPPKGLVFVLSLFVLFNLFVYDRALYGQFGIIAACGCLLFVAAYLLKAWQILDFRKLWHSAIFSGLALMFCPHFVFLLAPFYLLFLLGIAGKRREIKASGGLKKFWLACFLSVLIVLALSANWLVALSVRSSPLVGFVQEGITDQDLAAFATVGKNGAETLENVLLMSGFWGKEQLRYFDLTDAPGWQRAFVLLAPIILYGAYHSFRRRRRALKIFSASLLLIFALAVSLAIGIKSGATSGLATFLSDHLPLYKVMREPQKWVATIIPIYLFYLVLGSARLARVKVVANNRWVAGSLLAALIVMQAPSLLWGFNRQVRPTPYPDDWYAVNKLLVSRSAQPERCSDKILFLPWHLYMSFNWIGNVINNPARTFFTCPVISGTNMEWGGIYDNSTDSDGAAVDSWINARGKDGAPDLAGSPIRYVVLAKEVDFVSYKWLNDLSYVKPLLETRTLLVYEIKVE